MTPPSRSARWAPTRRSSSRSPTAVPGSLRNSASGSSSCSRRSSGRATAPTRGSASACTSRSGSWRPTEDGWISVTTRVAAPPSSWPSPGPLLRSRVRDRDQAEDLGPAGDVTFEHDPQSARVELHREHVRLEPRPFEAAYHVVQVPVGHRHAGGTLDDPRLIFGVSPEELLPVRVRSVRVDGHDDPRDRAVHPRLPRALAAAHASLSRVGGGPLTEVPDVPE